jgi:hypothetical protein
MDGASGVPPLSVAITVISIPAGMATAGMTCSIDTLKNATAYRMANRRLKG